MKIAPQPRAQRAAALAQKACVLLAVDRYGEALDAVRRARKMRAGLDVIRLGLLEAEALLGAERHAEAITLTTRLLAARPADADDRARLRAARAHALWLVGRTVSARRDARLAETEAQSPITRGRVFEVLALAARHDGRHDDALAHLDGAASLYASQDYHLGETRALRTAARGLRERGRYQEAADILDRSLEAASLGTRRAQLALSHLEKSNYLLQLGHWSEARTEAEAAAHEFRRHEDPREHTQAGVVLARVLLAGGDFAGARRALAMARVIEARQPSPAARAEISLHWADLELAHGDARAALAAADEALAISGRLHDPEGVCRARSRRVHALLEQGTLAPALREASRATREVPAGRPDLQSLAHLALGRVLARAGRDSAADAFSRAYASALPEHGYAHAALLGMAVARGRRREHAEIARALGGLEHWGDRRLVALCQHDLQRLQPVKGQAPPALPTPCAPAPLPAVATVVEAVACRLLEGSGWVAAARETQRLVPWRRLLLVGTPGWEIGSGRHEPLPLAPDDPWCSLASAISTPVVVRHADVPALEAWPTTRLHALHAAFAAPAAGGGLLVLEVGGNDEPPPEALAMTVSLAKMLPLPDAPVAEDVVTVPGLVAGCESMQALVREAILFASRGLGAVHVYGEAGAGKEKIAQLIHTHSPRSRGPFVPVNAAAIADSLFESEMFGAVKGAYTGAVADKQGYVEQAQGGTLFLDEVAELSLEAQAKLLRVVEKREYRRVGDAQLRHADVRFVTAANVRISDRVAAGRFRYDLWSRLKAFTLEVPPLRGRGGDIVRIARQCLKALAPRIGLPVPELTPAAVRLLEAHAWPENVRGLENEMGMALARAGVGAIRPEHLSPELRDAGPTGVSRTLREMAQEAERRNIATALALHDGNRARTARTLGLSRQALITKIARFGL